LYPAGLGAGRAIPGDNQEDWRNVPRPLCIRQPTVTHGYWENLDVCSGGSSVYSVDDTGPNSPNNKAYFVNWIGTGYSPCGETQHKFAFRQGTVYAPPDGYGFISSKTGWPWAAKEVDELVGSETVGLDRFGLNDNNQYQAGYALHLKNASTQNWDTWLGNSFPNTYVFSAAPPYYCVVSGATPAAFRTRDSFASGCL